MRATTNLARDPSYELVWSDEFDGTKLDATKWDHRWLGKRRDAINTKDSVKLDGRGHLVITTSKVGDEWHTGMIATAGKFEPIYGYFEARIEVQHEIGLWSAFWMQSPTYGKFLGEPGRSGSEIDVMEYLAREGDVVHFTNHWDGYAARHRSATHSLAIAHVREGFHTFGVEWTPDEYIYFVDGVETWRTRDGVSHAPEYLLLSCEVGSWGGDIANAQGPDELLVDYVRVYQRKPQVQQHEAPAPIAPIPSARQLAAADRELYAFVHFNMNTFTGNEWGTGREDEKLFAPTALDCRQWAKAAKDAGLKGIILTAKHHDGFCLWPSKFTEHSVKNSPWRDGKGDVVRELRTACDEFGLKMGLYLSPWDRNSQLYGDSQKYNDYYANQLTELCTNYGELFEIWWDGACGEGPNGKKQIYDFERFTKIVRELQPNAVIFSDIGPDVRWCGNESGFAGESNWSMISAKGFQRGEGAPPIEVLNGGLRDGPDWMQAECDVSIRPGWFYHAEEDGRVKTLDELETIYLASVGRNASMLLNLPVDRRGLVHEADVARLKEFGERLDATFANDLAADHDVNLDANGLLAKASSVRLHDDQWKPSRAIDGDARTFWMPDDGDANPWMEIELDPARAFNRILLQEPIALGQRVEAFRIDAFDVSDQSWRELASATTIGRERLLSVPTTHTPRVRVSFAKWRATPALATLGLYRAPPKVRIATTEREFFGELAVELASDDASAEIRYTLDGAKPLRTSLLYDGPIRIRSSCTLTATAMIAHSDASTTIRADFTSMTESELLPATAFFKKPDAGVAFSYFEGEWKSVAEIPNDGAAKTGFAESIDLAPASRDEHFALVFRGFVDAPRDGLYEFALASDDGSQLRVQDRLVVDDDGLHGREEKRGSIGLRAGWHPFELRYFNGGGARALDLRWKGPLFEFEPLHATQLAH